MRSCTPVQLHVYTWCTTVVLYDSRACVGYACSTRVHVHVYKGFINPRFCLYIVASIVREVGPTMYEGTKVLSYEGRLQDLQSPEVKTEPARRLEVV